MLRHPVRTFAVGIVVFLLVASVFVCLLVSWAVGWSVGSLTMCCMRYRRCRCLLSQAVRCLHSKVWSARAAALSALSRVVVRCMEAYEQAVADMAAAEDDDDDGVGGGGGVGGGRTPREPMPVAKYGDVLAFPPCSAKVFMQLCSVVEHGLWDAVAVVRTTSPPCVCVHILVSLWSRCRVCGACACTCGC